MMKTLPEALACPLCGLGLDNIKSLCQQCQDFYPQKLQNVNSNNEFLDLTINRMEAKPLRTELFRSSLIPWLYERLLPPIWSMGLRQIGGIEREYQEVCQFFGSDPKWVIDLSCGTGMMARKLSQNYSQIGAIDYSEKMLEQLQEQIKKEGINPNKILVIRGDVSALPLLSNSVDAIYAGAALHCWPDVQQAMNEIKRVLSPGGKLFATTFLKPLPSIVFRFFSAEDLKNIAETAGFSPDKIQVTCRGVYGILRCQL